jgi:hypothetical protein
MRDIRQDLKERLNAAETVRAAAEKQLRAAQNEVDMLTALLNLEASRTVDIVSGPERKSPDKPVADFIMDIIARAPSTKDEIKDYAAAARYFTVGDSPGRIIHATLVNLVRAGRVKALRDGRYAEAAPTLNGVVGAPGSGGAFTSDVASSFFGAGDTSSI